MSTTPTSTAKSTPIAPTTSATSTTMVIWFQLIDADGNAYKGTSVTSVRCSSSTIIDEFRDSVKAKYDQPAFLKDTPSSSLIVFQNKEAFDKKVLLEVDDVVDGSKTSAKVPLLVLVPVTPSLFPQLDNKLIEAIGEMLETRFKPHRSSVSVSSFSSTRMYEALTALGCSIFSKKMNEPSVSANCKVPGYVWINNIAEDHEIQRTGYMSYLNQYLGSKLPEQYHLVDVATKKTLLSLHDSRLPFNITGGTDVLISDFPDGILMLSAVRIIIELKKNVLESHVAQVIAELISADAKADSNHSVVALLTDLNNHWTFCWFTEGGKVCCTEFKEPKNAFDFIVNILSLPADTKTIPLGCNTMKQIKLDDIRPRMIDTHTIDQYESLELLKNDELDKNEMYGIQAQQKKLALRYILDHPIFHSVSTQE